MPEFLKSFLMQNILWCITCVSSVIAFFILNKKTENKYAHWTEKQFNLLFFSKKWTRSENDIIKELTDTTIDLKTKNEHLTFENKILKKQVDDLPLKIFLSISIGLFYAYFLAQFKPKSSKTEKVNS